jgi:hypothetical protein
MSFPTLPTTKEEISLSFFYAYLLDIKQFEKPLYLVNRKTGIIWQVVNLVVDANVNSYYKNTIKLKRLPGTAKDYLNLTALLLNELGGKND